MTSKKQDLVGSFLPILPMLYRVLFRHTNEALAYFPAAGVANRKQEARAA